MGHPFESIILRNKKGVPYLRSSIFLVEWIGVLPVLPVPLLLTHGRFKVQLANVSLVPMLCVG